jgi:DeoR/GlpR family transcriptional regulator of sugar metabolism
MPIKERHERILHLLEVEGMVKNAQLAALFSVTNETIRKDLEALESAECLLRVHGGAKRVADKRQGLPLPAREAQRRYEKAAVARAAVGLIEPGDTVFFDASSTVLSMAGQLPDMPVTVLTNAHHVIVVLGQRAQCDLICTGGNYEERSRSYVGPIAEDALKRFVIKWLFLGVDGLHPGVGASEVNPGQAVLKERLIARAEKVCVVCDSSKLGRKSPFIFAQLSEIDVLVTDDRADAAVIRDYGAAGVEVIQAALEPIRPTS